MTYADAIFGAIAGFIATWSISTAIAASELELGQQIGTFYSIIGIAIGFNNAVNSAYLGFGLHIITGSIVGAILEPSQQNGKKQVYSILIRGR